MDEHRPTPVELYERRRFKIIRASLVFFIFLIAVFVYWRYFAETPEDYVSDADHFKYGSIGSDTDYGGIPYLAWRVMPQVCSEHLPNPEAFEKLSTNEQAGLAGYRQFGFLVESGYDRPIGFSKRRAGLELVGLNCAVCHTSTVRTGDGMEPEKIYSDSHSAYLDAHEQRALVFGMPANTVDLTGYFRFLFDCAADPDFTVDNVMAHIDAIRDLGVVERILYRRTIPQLRENLLRRRGQLAFLLQVPPAGPGRVDTFNPYKLMVFGFPYDNTIGTADFPSLWNQRPRQGMQLHWDGNNTSVFERNISASLGANATPVSLDMPRMLRVAYWIGSPNPRVTLPPEQQAEAIQAARLQPVPQPGELPIPNFPFPIDAELAKAGKQVYQRECAACHDWQGKYVGTVVPIQAIGTDRERLDSFTRELIANQYTLGTGTWWRFNNFRKTDGYANMPLDGIWARAPYLHNGSVPTLRDLLSPPSRRPQRFYRGDDRYDPVNVGFRSDRPVSEDGRKLFEFRVEESGNGNHGHDYGTQLPEADKQSLLEYLKTL